MKNLDEFNKLNNIYNINPIEDLPPYKCKICGKYLINFPFDICMVCGWQDDGLQNDNPNYEGGANYISYNQYKHIWENHKDEIVNAGKKKHALIKEIFKNEKMGK